MQFPEWPCMGTEIQKKNSFICVPSCCYIYANVPDMHRFQALVSLFLKPDSVLVSSTAALRRKKSVLGAPGALLMRRLGN